METSDNQAHQPTSEENSDTETVVDHPGSDDDDDTNDHELDALTQRFSDISTQSLDIISDMKSKMNQITQIQQQFTSSASSINDISKQVNLLINAVNVLQTDMEQQNISTNAKQYTRIYLKSLSKSELIDVILKIQSRTFRSKSNQIWLDPHDETYTASSKGTERQSTDYDKIEKQRAVIKALKEKDDLKTLKDRNAHYQETQKVFADPHEKLVHRKKATERMATDYDKIEKQRAAIKALKEKKKMEKLSNPNGLKLRNANRTNHLFSNPHEKVFKVKPRPKSKDKKRNRDRNGTTKQKIVDPVSRQLIEDRANLSKLEPCNEDGDEEKTSEFDDRSENGDDEEANGDEDEDEYDEDEARDTVPEMNAEAMEADLLKMNMKLLKKKCRQYRISYEGSKLAMIARILKQEQEKNEAMMKSEMSAQDEFMREMARMSSRDAY